MTGKNDTKWRSKFRTSSFFVGTVVAVTLVALELGARWVFPSREIPDFDRLAFSSQVKESEQKIDMGHRVLWWWSEPDGAHFSRSLNLYGFSDREWKAKKRTGTERLVFVGDSMLEGIGASEDKDIVDQFRDLVKSSGLKLEALNMGVAGYGQSEYLRLLSHVVAFQPDEVVLLLYVNDFYSFEPEPEKLLAAQLPLPKPSFPQIRIFQVLDLVARDQRIPRRWRESPGKEPQAKSGARLRTDRRLADLVDLYVDPEIAASMRNGRLNPIVTNHLRRSVHGLSRPIQPKTFLKAIHRHLKKNQIQFRVVYLPSLNQVSDAYLPAQRRISASIEVATLTAPKYQQQARDLETACADLGIDFLDLTPILAAAEAQGLRLYWPFDGHMNKDGYQTVAKAIFDWRLN